ncbi:hypothetical protein ASG03_14230 [Rhizobium sp. Leaf341]|nr:hypothetical protein ASG03_14230 [Rhizobium sp. Leaf341]
MEILDQISAAGVWLLLPHNVLKLFAQSVQLPLLVGKHFIQSAFTTGNWKHQLTRGYSLQQSTLVNEKVQNGPAIMDTIDHAVFDLFRNGL